MLLPAGFRSLSPRRKAAQGPSEPHPPYPGTCPPRSMAEQLWEAGEQRDPFNPSPPPWHPKARSRGACEFPRRTLIPPPPAALLLPPPSLQTAPAPSTHQSIARGGGLQPCRGGGCRLWCRAALAHHAGIPMLETDAFCPPHGQGGYQRSAPPPSWQVPRELWHRSHARQGASPWWAALAV